MNENHNKQGDNRNNDNKNRKNAHGLAVLLGWAVVLTIAFNFLSDYTQQATTAATTHEIPYSEFIDLVESGQVEKVIFTKACVDGEAQPERIRNPEKKQVRIKTPGKKPVHRAKVKV